MQDVSSHGPFLGVAALTDRALVGPLPRVMEHVELHAPLLREALPADGAPGEEV